MTSTESDSDDVTLQNRTNSKKRKTKTQHQENRTHKQNSKPKKGFPQHTQETSIGTCKAYEHTAKKKDAMPKQKVLIKEVPIQALDKEESPVRCL